MYCTASGTVATCAFLFFYLILKTTATTTTFTEPTAVTVCNSTVAVYSNGFPLYTVIGKGCLVVPLLAENFTVSNGTVFFWDSGNVTLFSEPAEGGAKVSLPLWPVVTALLVLREVFSTKADF